MGLTSEQSARVAAFLALRLARPDPKIEELATNADLERMYGGRWRSHGKVKAGREQK